MPLPTQAIPLGITLGATQVLPPLPQGSRGLSLPAFGLLLPTCTAHVLLKISYTTLLSHIYSSLYECCK